MNSEIYGLLAQFPTPDALLYATGALRGEGYVRLRAFTPFPVTGLSEALQLPQSKLPMMVTIGGAIGGSIAYALQYFAAVWSYPWNIGGKPYHSWPAFVPVTFELTVLGASLTAVFGMLALNGLPRPYFPTFNVPEFARASRDRFFLCIEAEDEKFDVEHTRQRFEHLGAEAVFEVPK